jgi:hypothetical protein
MEIGNSWLFCVVLVFVVEQFVARIFQDRKTAIPERSRELV